MKTDQDLIFEAYATPLNEYNESRAKNIQRGQEAISAEQEVFYKEYGADAFEDHYGFRYPEEDYEDAASGKLDDDLKPIEASVKSGFDNFYAEGETFADKLSDEGLQFAIKNLNQLKGILNDEFGYRRQMEKENND